MSGNTPSTSGSTISTITGAPSDSGRGQQSRGGRGRVRGGRGNGGRSTSAPVSSRSNFKGATEEMQGNVFECYDEQRDRRQFAKTMEHLEIYSKKKFQHFQDLSPLFAVNMSSPSVPVPAEPVGEPTKMARIIWKEAVKGYCTRTTALTGNLAALYAVIWGQCSESMRAKLKAARDYIDKAANNDCFWLLKQIKSVTLQFDDKRNGYIALLDATANYLNLRQSQHQSVVDYVDALRGYADTIEYHGGSVVVNYKLVPWMSDDGTPRSIDERMAIAREKSMAATLVRGADPTRFGTLICHLANQFANGMDEYPQDFGSAHSLLESYSSPTNSRQRVAQQPVTPAAPAPATTTSAATFSQQGSVAGANGVLHEGITCFRCNSLGHYADECPQHPSRSTSGTTLTQFAYMLAQSKVSGIDPNWILLDSQSTISVFCNDRMLSNIRPSSHTLRALTNGGFQDSTMVGDFPNLGPVWYNKDSIANILSLADVRRVCRITMDTHAAAELCVHRLDGSTMVFTEHPSGLYVFDANIKDSNAPVPSYTMVSTVAEQKKMFSARDIHAADAARDLYRKLGRPDEAAFQTILRRGQLLNCPVTPDDARRALIIYGPDVAVLKGKTTRSSAAPRVPTYTAVPLPAPILKCYRRVTLCVDFLYVQGLPFFSSISRNLGYRTVASVPDRSYDTILAEVTDVVSVYEARGLEICDIHADGEFECVRADLFPIVLNIVPPDSHVGEIERSNRTLKERLRCCVHGLPFKRLPKLMIKHMLFDAVRSLNQFPWKYGVSSDLSPAAVVTGAGPPDFNNLRLEFGTYVQVFEDNTPSNTPKARSLGAIALEPTGNAQGDYYFMSLATGARISRHNWHALPMTDAAIARVEALAVQDKQPLIQASGLVVEWRPDQPIDDDIYDVDYDPPADPDDDFAAPLFDAIDDDELNDLLAPDLPVVPAVVPPLPKGAFQHPEAIIEEEGEINANHIDEVEENDIEAPHAVPDEDDEIADADVFDAALIGEDEGAPIDGDEGAQEAPTDEDEGAPTDEDEGAPIHFDAGAHDDEQNAMFEHEYAAANAPRGIPYNLRPRGPTGTRNSNFQTAMDAPFDTKSYHPPRQLFQTHRDKIKYIFAHVMTQMSAKAGIRKHGKAAEAALMAEFAQLEDLSVYQSVDPTKLTREQRMAALRAINLIKEKRDGRLKGRTVADGRSQRTLYDKSETASPTVSSDALILSIIIDAYEQRDVATADVAGAYLKAFMDDFVLMKFTGESVDILCKMNPEHSKFVTFENGVKTLYVRLVKAIYGCVKSALLWYNLFVTKLKKMGFVLNEYDPCIANCVIDGSQCTIAWYVDDNKISHKDPNVVTRMIKVIEEEFDTMTVTRGKEHVFLGMHVKYTDQRTAEITMTDYLKEAIEESRMDINKVSPTPATKRLFDVDEKSPPLSRAEGEIFHSVSAKLLYVAIRARMDLLLAVIFLCTRVSKSTMEDKMKLKRLLEYISGTMHLTYTVGADDMGKIRSWVDASYAVHPDFKSHTGGVMSLGRGGLICKSSKQKLNTKSSTEAELVGASDYLPNILWAANFLKQQGYDITENILEQDNESAIKLETNGRTSAGPRSRHIDIRYFWIKDRTKEAGIKIRHCPTLQMVGDFFTKPLQGSLFRVFRDVILGYKHSDALALDPDLSTEERVGIVQPNDSGTKAHGVSKTVTVQPATVSWADVVRTPKHTDARTLARSPHKQIVSNELILSKQSRE